MDTLPLPENCQFRAKSLPFCMTLDLRQIQAFLAVCEHRSLGRAAAHLNLTQPALSRTIQRLEAQLGAPLFERYSTGMVLTAYGEALLPHATLLRHEADHAIEAVRALRGLASGTIRVGAVASVVSGVLPQAIEAVLARWPNLRLRIIEGVGDFLADALAKREIDLAIGIALPENDEICAVSDVGWSDTSYVVAATGHPLMGKRGLKLADTRGCHWVMPPRGTAPFEELLRLFARHELAPPEIVAETRSIIALKSLVARAGFLSWIAEPMYQAEQKAGLIHTLPIPGASAPRRLTVYRRRHGILPAPAVRLLEQLRNLTATQA
ncbi:LysR family transcriptional regulator [Cupriavidus sp. L7L]|nr:LysR family transcriptional regulator [Cupriavidus sp. L7L]